MASPHKMLWNNMYVFLSLLSTLLSQSLLKIIRPGAYVCLPCSKHKAKRWCFLALRSAFKTRCLFKSGSCKDHVCFLCSQIRDQGYDFFCLFHWLSIWVLFKSSKISFDVCLSAQNKDCRGACFSVSSRLFRPGLCPNTFSDGFLSVFSAQKRTLKRYFSVPLLSRLSKFGLCSKSVTADLISVLSAQNPRQ